MRVSKKPSRKTVKKLHGAIKGILERESAESIENKTDKDHQDKQPLIPDITESIKQEGTQLNDFKTQRHRPSEKLRGNHVVEERNGILYIMSKENQLIPKLTDDEVMRLHKKADENMKQVWNDIIAKYEAVENQGDVVDLQTGELIEDNGHIRGISHENSETRYKSSLKGLIDVEEDDDGYSVWQDEGEEDEDNEEDDLDYQEELTESSSEIEPIQQEEKNEKTE